MDSNINHWGLILTLLKPLSQLYKKAKIRSPSITKKVAAPAVGISSEIKLDAQRQR